MSKRLQMKLHNWDLVLVGILAALAILLAFFDLPLGLLRSIPALALLLILPGYALTVALFRPDVLDGTTRLLFSIGLSLGLGALSALMLNWTTGGLQATSAALLLGSITLIATVLAVVRRTFSGGTTPILTFLGARQMIMLCGAVMIAVAAFGVARSGAQNARYVPVTQLWLLPQTEAGPLALTVGLHSLEAQPLHYHLQVTAGADVIQQWNDLTLIPGATWETKVTLTPAQAKQGPIAAVLYRADAPDEVYRRVTWQPGS